MPVVVLSGPRQSGKSTLLREESRLSQHRYVNLDDLNSRTALASDPEQILRSDRLVLDEVQQMPDALRVIKQAVDERREAGRFVLSGSANLLLMQSVSESLAGRAVYLHLGPFTLHEWRREASDPGIVRLLSGEPPEQIWAEGDAECAAPSAEDLLAGGFPPARLLPGAEQRQLWFAGYEQTYVERDVRQLSNIADLGLFQRFLRMAALRSGQILNLRELARDCGTNPVTISRWISLLEASELVFRSPPFYANQTRRLVKAPKLYLCDCGLMAYLCGITSPAQFQDHPLKGAVLETWMHQNLRGALQSRLPGERLLHLRSHEGHEVDFVVESASRVVGVEVKSGTRVDARDMKGLEALLDHAPRAVGVVASSGRRIQRLSDRLWVVPYAALV